MATKSQKGRTAPAAAHDVIGTERVANPGGTGAGTPPAIASRLRVPMSLDPIGKSGAGIAGTLNPSRLLAVSNLYKGIQQVHGSLSQLITSLADPLAPPQLIGSLAQPDGTPGARLQIQFDPATLGSTSPITSTITDDGSAFHLTLPAGLKLPVSSTLALRVHGGNGNATVSIAAAQIASNGLVPTLMLPQRIAPLQEASSPRSCGWWPIRQARPRHRHKSIPRSCRASSWVNAMAAIFPMVRTPRWIASSTASFTG